MPSSLIGFNPNQYFEQAPRSAATRSLCFQLTDSKKPADRSAGFLLAQKAPAELFGG
jgi:hypothetical protein